MKKLLIVAYLCLTCLSLAAQPYFNELYRSDSNKATIIRSIVATDTAWYVSGVTMVVEDSVPHNAGWFACIDTNNGDVVSQKIYSDTSKLLDMWQDALIATQEGNLAYIGIDYSGDTFFAVLNTNGDTLVYKRYVTPIDTLTLPTQIKQDNDGNYYAVALTARSIGNTYQRRVTLIKLNPLGEILSKLNFTFPDPICRFSQGTSDLQLLSNGHFIVSVSGQGPCPYYYPPDDSCRGRTWIFEADETGAIVWQYLSPADGYINAPKLTLIKDGGIVFSGKETLLVKSNSYISFQDRQYIGKLNSNHQLAWEYTNPHIGAAYFSRSVELADGSILVCGRIARWISPDSLRYAAVITKFSANGDSLGTQFYYRLSDYFHSGSKVGDRVEHYFQDMVILPDSSLVMVGEIVDNWTPSPTAGYWAWVVHTDKYGCVEQEGCFPVGIPPVLPLEGGLEGGLSVYMKVYPNPARDYVSFAYELPSKVVSGGGAMLIVSDVTGRTIQEITLTNLQGETVVDTRNLPEGLYYYSLLFGTEQLASGTVSIEK